MSRVLAGASINARDEDDQTPLHYAALCGNAQVGPVTMHMMYPELPPYFNAFKCYCVTPSFLHQ
jgi:hypothetical protein